MTYGIGFHTNCRCGDTLEETLALIKAAGFSVIQLDTKQDLEEGIKLAQKIGLKVHYVHLPYGKPLWRNTNDLWAKGAANEERIAGIIEQIKLCDKYNIPITVLHQTYKARKYSNEIHCEKQGIKSLQKILDATKNCNVKIALENLNPGDNKYMEILLDSIDDPRLGFCYDSGHNYLYTPDVDFMKKYGDRVIAIHLQDNLMDATDIEESNRDLHLLPFDGKIDFNKVMRNVARSSYNGPVILESKYRREKEETLYGSVPPNEFMKEAYKRGQRLAKMLEVLRKERV